VSKNCRPHFRTITTAQSIIKQFGRGKRKLLLKCMEVGRTTSDFYSGGRKLFWRKCQIQLLRLISMIKMGSYSSKGSFVFWAHALKAFMPVVDHI
jgi:hypothetical protein